MKPVEHACCMINILKKNGTCSYGDHYIYEDWLLVQPESAVVWPDDEGMPLFWALILVRAAAASSKAQLTDEVSWRNTLGSVKALPSASFPTPEYKNRPRHLLPTDPNQDISQSSETYYGDKYIELYMKSALSSQHMFTCSFQQSLESGLSLWIHFS